MDIQRSGDPETGEEMVDQSDDVQVSPGMDTPDI